MFSKHWSSCQMIGFGLKVCLQKYDLGFKPLVLTLLLKGLVSGSNHWIWDFGLHLLGSGLGFKPLVLTLVFKGLLVILKALLCALSLQFHVISITIIFHEFSKSVVSSRNERGVWTDLCLLPGTRPWRCVRCYQFLRQQQPAHRSVERTLLLCTLLYLVAGPPPSLYKPQHQCTNRNITVSPTATE